MSFAIKLNIPEDSQYGHAIVCLAAKGHISPKAAPEQLLNKVSGPESGQEPEARSKVLKPGHRFFGLLRDDPATVQAIRDYADRRREET